MKKTNITYWIFTGLLAVGMLFSSIPNIMVVPQAVEIFKHLGYPLYLIPFLGIAKLLGVVGILVPGYPRLKEWAYAGLFFDITGAMYSAAAVGDPPAQWVPALIIGYVLIFGSYIFYHKRKQAVPVSRPAYS